MNVQMMQAIVMLVWLLVLGIPTAIATIREQEIRDAIAFIRGCGVKRWIRTVMLNRSIRKISYRQRRN